MEEHTSILMLVEHKANGQLDQYDTSNHNWNMGILNGKSHALQIPPSAVTPLVSFLRTIPLHVELLSQDVIEKKQLFLSLYPYNFFITKETHLKDLKIYAKQIAQTHSFLRSQHREEYCKKLSGSIGLGFAKRFDSDMYYGTIISFDRWWKVKYEDGDEEEHEDEGLEVGLALHKENINKRNKLGGSGSKAPINTIRLWNEFS
jgi:hypothetical protein